MSHLIYHLRVVDTVRLRNRPSNGRVSLGGLLLTKLKGSAYLEEIKIEQNVSMVVQAAIPPTMTTQEIAEATSLGPESYARRSPRTSALSKSLDHYRRILSELSVTREVRDHRIVIHKILRKRVVELATKV